MFVTAEYRRGLIRTTLAARPRRGRVLAAKAAVVGGVTFVVGLVTAAVVVTVGQHVLRANGVYVHAATTATQLRLVAGTAALLAVGAVLGLALGALLRRSVPAVATAVVLIVLPYLLALTVLPGGGRRLAAAGHPGRRVRDPASAPRYHQVDNLYIADHRLLPAAAVGRVRGARRLDRGRPHAGGRAAVAERRMNTLHAEWTKLRTASGTLGLLLAWPSRSSA